jgi:2-iminobutanoate/2-iminopropanoate deaminase
MPSMRHFCCSIATLATLLVVGCGYRLPGAMGPKETPDELRRRHGDAAKYLLEAPRPGSVPEARSATRSAPPAAKPLPGTVSGSPVRQAAVAPARGRNAPGEAPAATRYGDLFFISGQLPTDVRGNPTEQSRVEEQTRLAMENVRAVLEANQMTMANIISTTVYLKDLADIQAFDSIYSTYFSGALPARSVVEVSRLPNDAKVEVSAVAGR